MNESGPRNDTFSYRRPEEHHPARTTAFLLTDRFQTVWIDKAICESVVQTEQWSTESNDPNRQSIFIIMGMEPFTLTPAVVFLRSDWYSDIICKPRKPGSCSSTRCSSIFAETRNSEMVYKCKTHWWTLPSLRHLGWPGTRTSGEPAHPAPPPSASLGKRKQS